MARKNRIDVEYAMCVLDDNGFNPEPFRDYQIRIRKKKGGRYMYDWYHTTGAVVATRNSIPSRVGSAYTVEQLLGLILSKEDYDNIQKKVDSNV